MEVEYARMSVFTIHITPVSGVLTVKARKLLTALARAASAQYQRLPEKEREVIERSVREYVGQMRAGRAPGTPPVLYQPRFTARLQDLATAVGHDTTDARHLVEDLRRLVGTVVDINVLGHGAHKEEQATYPAELAVRSTLVSSLVKSGRSLVGWGYDPLLFLLMVNPRTYAQLSLELQRNARTYTALALYENVKRFVGISRAGPYPVRKWQELLSSDGKVQAWENPSEFKRKVRRAMEELTACGSDIDMEMREVHIPGQGRGLEFGVRARPQIALFTEPIPENRELTAELETLGFQRGEARQILENYGEEYVYAKLRLLKSAKQTTEVRNDRAWLTAAVQKDWVDRDAEDDKLRAERDRKTTQRRERERLQLAYEELRRNRVLEVFGSLSEAKRTEMQEEFRSSPSGPKAQRLGAPSSKGYQGVFKDWLLQQHEAWLTEDHETDFAAYVLWAKDREAQPAAA